MSTSPPSCCRSTSCATPARSACRRPGCWCRRASTTSSSASSPRAVKAARIGDGMESGTQMGPMANPRRIAAMESLYRRRGAKGRDACKTGGNRIGNKGNFFEPTVLTDVPMNSRIMNEEPFGPVAVIAPFKSFRRCRRGGQPAALRPRRLCLHPLGEDREGDRRRGRDRHDLDQPSRPGTARGAVRRRQGFAATAPKAAPRRSRPTSTPSS